MKVPSLFQRMITVGLKWQPVKELVRPPNQLQLSKAELEEEIACVLSSAKPDAPSNVARWSLKEHVFKTVPFTDHLLHHYSSEGWLAHQDSALAAEQSARTVSSQQLHQPRTVQVLTQLVEDCSVNSGFVPGESRTCWEGCRC
jgi:dynein intermediate chain 1